MFSDTQDLGKVSLTLHGAYNNETTYEKLSIVSYDNCGWISKKTTTGNRPSRTDDEFWQLLGDGDYSTQIFMRKEFERYHDAVNKTIRTIRDAEGNVTRVEVSADDFDSTTTYTRNNKVVTVITNLVPKTGAYSYLKTLVTRDDVITQTYTMIDKLTGEDVGIIDD